MICLEKILKKQSTYFIINLKLTKLFKEIFKRSKIGLIPILETRILLRVLIDIPFLNEEMGIQILKDLTNCIINHWYTQKCLWNAKSILSGIRKLKKLIPFDYDINGSFIKYNDDYFYWDLEVSMI